MSLTYNTFQSSQPSYLCQLFKIQPPRSTHFSSTLTLLRPSVTSSLKFSNPNIAIAVPPLWNKLPPVLRQISPPSYERPHTRVGKNRDFLKKSDFLFKSDFFL